MPRPPKADRDAVKSIVVGVKFSAPERAVLDRLVSQRAGELERLAGGQKIDMSASAFIRWLVAKEAKEQEIDPSSLESPEPGPVAARPAPKASVPKASVPKAKPSKGKIESGKGRRR